MNDNDDIWRTYTENVKPLPALRKKQLSVKKPAKIIPSPEGLLVPSSVTARPASIADWHTLIDKKAERDMRSGDVEIDARIDLHGMTQAEAHKALARFIAMAVRNGHRLLLIITGKGKNRSERLWEPQSEPDKKGEGVLRSNLPAWLEALPEAGMISKLRPASVKHGGTGAAYVVLRRSRP